MRFDEIEEVRSRPGVGEEGSESKVLRRDKLAPCADVAVLTEFERWGSSVLEEFALDVLMSVNLAP